MKGRATRLAGALAPWVVLLAAVGVVFVVELALRFDTPGISHQTLVTEASIAIRNMFELACWVGMPLSIIAWFGSSPSRRYPILVRLLVFSFAALATTAVLLASFWPLRGSAAGSRDVILIVADTLRADLVTAERAPNMMRLAEEGVHFPEAQSNAPWTLPSFGTLLTGHFPRSHGAGVDGDRGSSLGPLRPDLATLAEAFRASGYQTVALTTNPHLRRQNGLDRGFDEYRNLMRDHMLFSAVFPIAAQTRFAPATVQTDRALMRLGLRDPERPLFLLLHYMDPHLPREPSASLLAAERAADPGASPEALAYGAMVRSLDRSVGRLLDTLEAGGRLDHTVIALTSDHGEGLEVGTERWDHGGPPNPEVVRVPLMFRLPERRGAGSLCPGLVSHIDLGATLLGTAGLTPSLGEGRPLLGVDGQCGPAREVAFQSMTSKGPATDGLTTPTRGLMWKRPDQWLAFDRQSDPEYRRPLAESDPRLRERLQRHIEKQREQASRSKAPEPTTLSPEILDQLQALGYMDAGDGPHRDRLGRPRR